VLARTPRDSGCGVACRAVPVGDVPGSSEATLTALRQRLVDAVVLRGFAARTQETCLSAVGRMARHHHCNPEPLSGAQVPASLLFLLRKRQRPCATVNRASCASCALRFQVCAVLGQRERCAQLPTGRVPQRLPEVLSRAEVGALPGVPMALKARTVLTTACASGLRLTALCKLRGRDINSPPDRMCIRVV
jgi:integrase